MSPLGFLREYLRNWKSVGAVAPSSQALARCMMSAAQVGNATHILELGPGTGAFTQAIAVSKPEHAGYVGIEMNGEFVKSLRLRFPALDFHQAAAQEFDFDAAGQGSAPFDVIISGLPWAAFPSELQTAILDHVLPRLAPGGRFATFAYWGFHRLPSGCRFRELLQQRLKNVELTRVVWGNLPPAFVYVGRK
jgi:phosphatidylethanolamine/phosphatidyl-N-methylethanolamine N-methyltransferase